MNPTGYLGRVGGPVDGFTEYTIRREANGAHRVLRTVGRWVMGNRAERGPQEALIMAVGGGWAWSSCAMHGFRTLAEATEALLSVVPREGE